MRALKYILLIFLIPLILTPSLMGQTVNLTEIETLIAAKKYSIALEKSLNILTTMESRLSPLEAASLNYYIGIAYKNDNNRDMAINYLKKIELQFPTSPHVLDSYIQLTELYKDDYFQREAYLQKIFERYPKTAEAIKAGIELSQGYINLKNFKKSIPVLEKMVNEWKVAGANPEIYILIAISYSGINDYIEAIDYLRIIEKNVPALINEKALYLFEAGKISYNTQNFKNAIVYLSKLIKIYKEFKDIDEATLLLAQSYERENNLAMSAVFLIKAVQADKGDQKKKFNLLLNLGRILGKMPEKDLAQIRKNYPSFADAEKILTQVKDNSPIFEYKRNAAILLSELYKKGNDYEKVIENFYEFLEKKRDPQVEKQFKENLDYYINDLFAKQNYDQILRFWIMIKERKSLLSGANLIRLAEVLYSMKLYLNSEEICNHTRKYTLYSAFWEKANMILARIYFQTGKFEEFEKLALKLSPSNPGWETDEFLFYKVTAMRETGKLEAHRKVVSQLTLESAGNDFQFNLLEQKAVAMEEQKKYLEAQQIYESLLDYSKLDKERRSYFQVKAADMCVNNRNWQAALDYYDQAGVLPQPADNEWVAFRRIYIYKKTGRTKEAQQEFERLKTMNPHSYWLQQAEKDVR